MRTLGACALVWSALVGSAAGQDDIRSSIVKVYTTYQEPKQSEPWNMQGQDTRIGSGCVIAGERVLTNAHVVSDATFIQVRRAGEAERFVAQVHAVSHELDLALLTVEKRDFFKGAKRLELGALARVGERVVAFGFPKGGTRITITEGVVSRIDRSSYSHSYHDNLVCQIDAAINPGSSGGPVISGGKIVGVAFQATSGQSIGYMVPAPVVRHFFTDLEDGNHDGVPALPFAWQVLHNSQLRAFHGMAEGQTGIMITSIAPRFEGEDKLQRKDILLSIDGTRIANDGTIEFRPQERIPFRYLIDVKQLRDRVAIQLLRGRKPRTVEITLETAKDACGHLVPRLRYETRPTYYIVGGLVFAPLTTDYFAAWDKWENVPLTLRRYYHESRTSRNKEREQVVVLIDVLPDELNVGYTGFEDHVIATVNGRKITGMRQLIEAFERHEGESHRIVLEEYDWEMVLLKEKLRQRHQVILDKYDVPHDRSADLR
ncbi:MAG: S1C family serine protease [Planctomycetota bacterium]|jgi:S1-C subfamily serine protease